MAIAFRFRWMPFVAALIAAGVGIALGQWQLQRAQEKEAIEHRMAERERQAPLQLTGQSSPAFDQVEYRIVSASGEFLADWPIYLDNRPYQGRAGFYLLMPLRIAGTGHHVLVARGWLPRDVSDRQKIAPVAVPSGPVQIQGRVRRHAGHVLQLGQPEAPRPGAILQNVDLDKLAQASGLQLLPFIIEQTGDAGDGLIRDWPRPSAGTDKHLGYAFQWFALAATALIFFLVTGFRNGSKK